MVFRLKPWLPVTKTCTLPGPKSASIGATNKQFSNIINQNYMHDIQQKHQPQTAPNELNIRQTLMSTLWTLWISSLLYKLSTFPLHSTSYHADAGKISRCTLTNSWIPLRLPLRSHRPSNTASQSGTNPAHLVAPESTSPSVRTNCLEVNKLQKSPTTCYTAARGETWKVTSKSNHSWTWHGQPVLQSQLPIRSSDIH